MLLPMVIDSSKAAFEENEWIIHLNIKTDETDEGMNYTDTLVFGELADASSYIDDYDMPKPPTPQSPYIRAWFTTNLNPPYNFLWEEYRKYPDDYNIWNFTVMWAPDNDSSIGVTISWDTSQVIDTEYSSTYLYSNDNLVADMMTEDRYNYLHSANTPYNFKIISQSDEIPSNGDTTNGDTTETSLLLPLIIVIIIIIIIALVFIMRRKK
jgi:hypothetical protein